MRTTAPLRTVLWAHRERPSPVGTGARVLALARAATAWRRRGSPGKEITLNHPIHPDNFSQPASQPWVKFWDPFRSTLPCHLRAKEASKSSSKTKSKSFCRTSAKSQAQTSSRLRMVHFAELRQSPKPKPHHACAWFILPICGKDPKPKRYVD